MVAQAYQDLCDAGDLEDLRQRCGKLLERYSVPHYLYGQQTLSLADGQPDRTTLHTYPQAWWDRYNSENYYQVDPVLAHAFTSTAPLDWVDAARTPEAQAMMADAAAHGLVHGMTVAMHAPGSEFALLSLVTESSPSKHRDWFRMVGEAYALLNMLHERVSVLLARNKHPIAKLTPREIEVIKWAAGGKTSWETSTILGIAEGSVNFHLRNVIAKLGASSKTQAIARAISLHLVS